MKIKLEFIIILFFCASCQYDTWKNIQIDQIITFDLDDMKTLSEDIDSVQYLSLEDNQKTHYSNNSKVIFQNQKIFIGDFIQHKVIVYNNKGQFLYTIDNKGRASNEYLEIKSFCVTDNELVIIDNFNHFLKIYDVETGHFLENKVMPFVAWDVEWTDNDEFIFAFSSLQKGYNPNKWKYRLYFTDKNLNITKKLFPYKENEIDPIGKMTYFSRSQDKIIFHWCGANYFSVIDRVESDSIKIIAIDFGSRQIPDEYKEDIDKIDQGGYNYIYNTPVSNGDHIVFEIMSQNYSNCYLYSMNNKMMKKNGDRKNISMSYPSCIDEQGRFICLLDSPDEYEMYIENGYPRASKEIENHIKNGGVIILCYTMK